MAQEIEVQPIENAAATPSPLKMSYEEFLEWADEDVPAEWVNGEIHLMSPVSRRHQDVADFLLATLRFFVEVQGSGKVFSAPFQMKLLNGREPDLLFVAREHLARLKEMYLDGPADLAVEVISTESRTRDRRVKFDEYRQGGVREYWLIYPLRKQAEFYQLDAEGSYQIIAPVNGIYHSAVLEGLQLQVVWLWQEPLPPLMSVLKEWNLI